MKQVVSLDFWGPEARADEEFVYLQLALSFVLRLFEEPFELI
jgi:hypothetical protein